MMSGIAEIIETLNGLTWPGVAGLAILMAGLVGFGLVCAYAVRD